MSQVYLMDPSEVLDFSVDWTSELASGEAVSSCAWSVEGGDGLLTLGSATLATSVATQPVSTPTKGQVYTLVCLMTTNSSPARKYERRWTIRGGSR